MVILYSNMVNELGYIIPFTLILHDSIGKIVLKKELEEIDYKKHDYSSLYFYRPNIEIFPNNKILITTSNDSFAKLYLFDYNGGLLKTKVLPPLEYYYSIVTPDCFYLRSLKGVITCFDYDMNILYDIGKPETKRLICFKNSNREYNYLLDSLFSIDTLSILKLDYFGHNDLSIRPNHIFRHFNFNEAFSIKNNFKNLIFDSLTRVISEFCDDSISIKHEPISNNQYVINLALGKTVYYDSFYNRFPYSRNFKNCDIQIGNNKSTQSLYNIPLSKYYNRINRVSIENWDEVKYFSGRQRVCNTDKYELVYSYYLKKWFRVYESSNSISKIEVFETLDSTSLLFTRSFPSGQYTYLIGINPSKIGMDFDNGQLATLTSIYNNKTHSEEFYLQVLNEKLGYKYNRIMVENLTKQNFQQESSFKVFLIKNGIMLLSFKGNHKLSNNDSLVVRVFDTIGNMIFNQTYYTYSNKLIIRIFEQTFTKETCVPTISRWIQSIVNAKYIYDSTFNSFYYYESNKYIIYSGYGYNYKKDTPTFSLLKIYDIDHNFKTQDSINTSGSS